MRTIRAYRATEWVKLDTEYKVMNWRPAPPNPLQHRDRKTAIENYAAKGSDDIQEAYKRCLEKYGNDPELRQPWMDKYD